MSVSSLRHVQFCILAYRFHFQELRTSTPRALKLGSYTEDQVCYSMRIIPGGAVGDCELGAQRRRLVWGLNLLSQRNPRQQRVCCGRAHLLPGENCRFRVDLLASNEKWEVLEPGHYTGYTIHTSSNYRVWDKKTDSERFSVTTLFSIHDAVVAAGRAHEVEVDIVSEARLGLGP